MRSDAWSVIRSISFLFPSSSSLSHPRWRKEERNFTALGDRRNLTLRSRPLFVDSRRPFGYRSFCFVQVKASNLCNKKTKTYVVSYSDCECFGLSLLVSCVELRSSQLQGLVFPGTFPTIHGHPTIQPVRLSAPSRAEVLAALRSPKPLRLRAPSRAEVLAALRSLANKLYGERFVSSFSCISEDSHLLGPDLVGGGGS